MMATPYPAQAGMGPGHPGMAHGHPMQVQHGAHMGQPNPAMMAAMHPAMSGPQVTQGGPMASGMPTNPGTPAPGGPMQNAMAMAHLGGQGPIFQNQHPGMGVNQMQQMNANMIARQRAINMMASQNGQHGMMHMQNMQNMQNIPMNPAQMHQMKAMNMPMQQMQQMQHMTPQQQQSFIQQQQQYQTQQRMLAQHAANQQQMMSRQAQAQQQQQQQQQAQASQQMQMSRSQEPVTQPPQPQPTPAPQAQVQPQAQSQPAPQAQQQTPQQKPQQPPPPTTQPQQQNVTTPQIKQGDPDDEVQTKAEINKQQILLDESLRGQTQDFSGQCILQLLSYYDSLACPQRPYDLDYWQEVMAKYYSPLGSVRQQLYNAKTHSDKSFQLRYPSLARFYHSHFRHGIKKIFMQSFEHSQGALPNGGFHVWSKKLYVTYEYDDGVRIMTHGELNVNFDEMQKIEHLHVAVKGWTEFVPRAMLEPQSPEQSRQSPKLSKKNLPKAQPRPMLRRSPVNEWGVPPNMLQFLEIAEVMTTMEPLMEYYCTHAVGGPREAFNRLSAERQEYQTRLQNANAAAANGQIPFPNQRMVAMNPPNQFQSPALAHLHLPQNQHSPTMNHTPSPGHPSQGGIQMVHQMSAQGSNLSGSQGPSTNTSPNVTSKRRRASNIKEEETAAAVAAGNEKTKPSPRVNAKRQKGAPA
ncbi:hypothetical protein LTS08_004285 [Lithohypha guttulata]|uniref:Uncharacterized protein n=1 Tax=Lithohypha guttulata TaxID=1690604 RepID=A0AAN7T072_9EURO|nr:hypothetical protein LTR05_003574 [Lithohypha guttulata]KAK5101826.1 hypothetical protein LTS08_004285 [Lithohypha guttulata]